MNIEKTFLEGCIILKPSIFKDSRGYFFESFNKEKFEKVIGRGINFVQDNQSSSTKGVMRGLHLQTGIHAQAKLVRVTQGEVLDVAVDFRKGSPTFGKSVSVVLSSENKKQLFVPRGFAHGFIVLSNSAELFYKCDNYYNKDSENGIIYNDSNLAIDWKMSGKDIIISEKDKELPTLEEFLKTT